MEFRGKLKGYRQENGELVCSFTVESPSLTTLVQQDFANAENGVTLTVKATKYRPKRSLNANAYAWTLMSKIAQKMTPPLTKDEVYEMMLNDYGTPKVDEDGQAIGIMIPTKHNIGNIPGHWKLVEAKPNGFSMYALMKGSSDYNSQEMAKFIEGVVFEAKELGIETATPDEIKRMSELWGV